MQHDAFIAAFRQLHTNDSRLNALTALAQELTSHEWRTLQEIAATCTFQVDIIGQLPLELVAQIFTHLDTSTPYRLQSVSRKWRHVLQSPEVLTNSLVSWYGYTPQLLRADYDLCRLKAQSIHRFRHGCPKHHFRITDIPRKNGHMILMEDVLVFTAETQNDPTPRALCLFDIKTWRRRSLTGDARERISQIFASDEIVGFTTESRVCYVWDLDGRAKRRFSLPSPALFQSIACRGHVVACAGCLQGHAEVYIWDYNTQQGKSFRIEFNSPLFPFPKIWRNHKHGMALLLQPEAERIIVFTDERCSGGSEFDDADCHLDEGNFTCLFRYAQFTYEGQCISQSEFLLEDMHPFQYAAFQNNSNYFTPVDKQGTFKISFGSFSYAPATRWLQFDERTNKFTKPVPTKEHGPMWAWRSMFWWKDTMYASSKATEQLQSPTPSYLTYMGTSGRPQNKPLLFHEHSGNEDPDSVPARDSVVLNEKYLVRPIPDGFHLFCFEDSSAFPQVNGSFFDRGTLEICDI